MPITRRNSLHLSLILTLIAGASVAHAGAPGALSLGEAPILFTAAEGEAGNGTLLRDGQAARGDEIWLWVPAVTGGQVNLGVTGQFFKVWDSGPVAGPDGNDDDRNGMRGMDFNPITGKFLISYEDTTTTGFAFGNILDGDLMEMTPTSVSGGTITGHSFTRLFSEGTNGIAGNIGTGDINAISSAANGSLFIGSGGSQTIVTNVPGSLSVGASTLMHLDPTAASGSPENIGPNKFFEAGLTGVPIGFAPGIYVGQLRGADILDDGLVTFGTSDTYSNTTFTGPISGLTDAQAFAISTGVAPVGDQADILAVFDLFDGSKNTYEQRTATVLYDGSLFFQFPAVGNAGILDHDILNLAEINALISLLGANSDAGIALRLFPEPSSLILLAFGGFGLVSRRRR